MIITIAKPTNVNSLLIPRAGSSAHQHYNVVLIDPKDYHVECVKDDQKRDALRFTSEALLPERHHADYSHVVCVLTESEFQIVHRRGNE